ncbi:MAG: transposase [Promethearchaeota archaeon]
MKPSIVGEKMAFMDGHLRDIVERKLFKRFVADKLYDSSDFIEALESGGIEACIPSRAGKLRPLDGARARASKNYERLRKELANLRSLVESCISSLTAFYTDYVRSRRYERKEMEIGMLGQIHNVAGLCVLDLI